MLKIAFVWIHVIFWWYQLASSILLSLMTIRKWRSICQEESCKGTFQSLERSLFWWARSDRRSFPIIFPIISDRFSDHFRSFFRSFFIIFPIIFHCFSKCFLSIKQKLEKIMQNDKKRSENDLKTIWKMIWKRSDRSPEKWARSDRRSFSKKKWARSRSSKIWARSWSEPDRLFLFQPLVLGGSKLI